MPAVTNASGAGTAGVTSGDRLMGEVISRDYAEEVARKDGWAFTCSQTVTPTGAADVFARIANLSSDDLVISKIVASAASAEIISVQTCANYVSATSHTDRIARNRNAASANLFVTKGTFESDVDITGDSGAVEQTRLAIGVAADHREMDLRGSELVIPNGYSLILEAVTGAIAITFTVFCHFAVAADSDT